MANIAQTINVLQAMILTEEGGDRMVLTPSYHAFEMYRVHHDATLLPLHLESATHALGDVSLPAVSATASRDAEGRVHLTLTNTDPGRDQEVSCSLRGMSASGVAGRLLSADSLDAHNTFDDPERVRPRRFRRGELAARHADRPPAGEVGGGARPLLRSPMDLSTRVVAAGVGVGDPEGLTLVPARNEGRKPL